jgi:SET domain-containing protein
MTKTSKKDRKQERKNEAYGKVKGKLGWQTVHRAPHKDLKVKKGVDGLGVFATAPIKKGAFLMEYWGEIISEEEGDRRGGRYLFELEGNRMIDGKGRENTARYINHSCSPNAEPEEDEKASRVMVYAKRDIMPGEEIGYDYGKEYWDEHIKPKGCRCGCGGKGPKKFR